MNGNEKVNALLGVKETEQGGGEDWKSIALERERELNSAKVEQGRVKAMDARIKALEKELEGYRSKGGAQALLEGLSEDERGEVSSDYANVAATVAVRAAKSEADKIRNDIARERQEREEFAARERESASEKFVAQVEAKYPGFFNDIKAGGSKNAAWVSFLEDNAHSVKAAFDACNIKSLTYHIDRFYRETLKVNPPRGTASPAAADPDQARGTTVEKTNEGGERTYTQAEFSALEKKAMDLRRRGKFSDYAKLSEELDNALVQGRVK